MGDDRSFVTFLEGVSILLQMWEVVFNIFVAVSFCE